jgi:uncharacterized damage-inducible protein DinB
VGRGDVTYGRESQTSDRVARLSLLGAGACIRRLRGADAGAVRARPGNSFKSVRDTLVHNHFAETLWYARWAKSPFTAPVPESFPDLDSIRKASREHEAKMRALLERLGQDGVNRRIAFTSRLDGKDHNDLFWQMFQHVVNHGTYHRGQVTMMLKLLGAKPVGTDLIVFYWEREAAQV